MVTAVNTYLSTDVACLNHAHVDLQGLGDLTVKEFTNAILIACDKQVSHPDVIVS